MIRILITGVLVIAVAGCGNMAARLGLSREKPPGAGAEGAVSPDASGVAQTALAPATAAPPPPPSARTAEALDTTTPAQRAAAAAPAAVPSKTLGRTVASLGSPTEPGLWLKTPLVSTEQQGRVTNPANGKSSLVTLIPLAGPPTAGSRMSLAAMRIIEVSLTDLTEVDVALEG